MYQSQAARGYTLLEESLMLGVLTRRGQSAAGASKQVDWPSDTF
jgi:hypothetical protein